MLIILNCESTSKSFYSVNEGGTAYVVPQSSSDILWD